MPLQTHNGSPADTVEQLQVQLEESCRRKAESKAVSPNSDALCKKLRDKLESSQRAAAMEIDMLQVSTCN